MRVGAEQVALRLDISHIPVREALRYLEAEGHLERNGRKGLSVAAISFADAAEIYRIRELLEDEAYSSSVSGLTETDISQMAQHLEKMEIAVAQSDLAGFASQNRQFHFVPFHRGNQKWTIHVLNIIWDAAARYQSLLFRDSGWEEPLITDHHALLAACRAKDPEEVNRIMRGHRSIALNSMRLRTIQDSD